MKDRPPLALRNEKLKIFDPIVRSRTQSDEALKNLKYFGTTDVVTTSYGGRGFERAAELLTFFRDLLGGEMKRLERCGLNAYGAIGVAPNARPRRAHPEVWKAMPELLCRPEVVAVGEIGVWEDTSRQWELFERQVRLAQEAGLALLIATPRELRVTLTYKMMSRLEKVGFPGDRVLFSPVDVAFLQNVIESGFCAGYPVSAGINEPREAAAALAQLVETTAEPEALRRGVLLSAHLRRASSDVLGVPKALRALSEAGLDGAYLQSWSWGNARRLFGLPEEEGDVGEESVS